MRLFNSAITSLVFLGILTLTTKRTRLAGLSSWTFTVVPIAFLKFPTVNPRGWSLLGAMTSWIFFHELLKRPKSNKRNQTLLWIAYLGSAFLAFATRIDSSVFVIFTTCLILLQHLTQKIALNTKYLFVLVFSTLSIGKSHWRISLFRFDTNTRSNCWSLGIRSWSKWKRTVTHRNHWTIAICSCHLLIVAFSNLSSNDFCRNCAHVLDNG